LYLFVYKMNMTSQPTEICIMPTESRKRPTQQRKGYPGPVVDVSKKNWDITIPLISQIVIVAVAIIGCISAVTVAFLGSPVVPYLLPLTSTPTFTSVPPSDTPTHTAIPSATFTDTPTVVATLTPSETPTPSPTSTETPVPPKMVVVLWANKYGGNVPFTAQFSAADSYVQLPDGTKSYCTPSACTFTWAVYYADNQQAVATPMSWRETFASTFYRETLYYIQVTVCQGDICGSGQTQVEGR
jgi:hypothetical protein